MQYIFFTRKPCVLYVIPVIAVWLKNTMQTVLQAQSLFRNCPIKLPLSWYKTVALTWPRESRELHTIHHYRPPPPLHCSVPSTLTYHQSTVWRNLWLRKKLLADLNTRASVWICSVLPHGSDCVRKFFTDVWIKILKPNLKHTISNTGCPTRYRTRHFFNNSKNQWRYCNEIWTGVRSLSSHILHNEVSPLQISLQYPH